MHWLFIFFFITILGNNINASSKEIELVIDQAIDQVNKVNLSIVEIDNIVNETLTKFNVPGLSISIVFDDDVILSKGYGFCDLAQKLPVTEHTLFLIGSCTKAFTAAALCSLAEEGKVALDDVVQKYIPEFFIVDHERTADLTIRDLLAHRTGIARYDPVWIYSQPPRTSIIELLKYFEPACALREKFQYNSFMYTLAGIIIERITNDTWEEFISSRIFKPLAMNNSLVSLEHTPHSDNFSLPYAQINGINTSIPFFKTSCINPSGGIISSARDMANWLKWHINTSCLTTNIVSRRVLKEAYTIQIPLPIPYEEEKVYYHSGYGLGWFIGKYRGYNFVSHNGDIDGFSSELAFIPEKKIGLVILTNSSTNGHYAIATIKNQLFDKILGVKEVNWLNKMQEKYLKTKNSLEKNLNNFQDNCLIPYNESLEPYVGVYAHPAYGKVVLKMEDNNLTLIYGKIKTAIYYKEENLFEGLISTLLHYETNPISSYKFFKDASGSIYKLEIPFEQFRSAKPITFLRLNTEDSEL